MLTVREDAHFRPLSSTEEVRANALILRLNAAPRQSVPQIGDVPKLVLASADLGG